MKTMREMEAKVEDARQEERSAYEMICVLNTAVNVKSWRRNEALRHFMRRMIISVIYFVIFFQMSCAAPDYSLSDLHEWSTNVRAAVADSNLDAARDPASFWSWMKGNIAGDPLTGAFCATVAVTYTSALPMRRIFSATM